MNLLRSRLALPICALLLSSVLSACGVSSAGPRAFLFGDGGTPSGGDDGGGDPFGGTPDPTPQGQDMNCGGMLFGITRVPPNVMLVLDRSGSMLDPIARNNKSTKWANLKTAIESLVKQFDTQARFGLDLFPGQAGGLFGSGCDPGPIAVKLGAAHGAQVQNALDRSAPDGSTPTAATLDAVIAGGGLSDPTRDNVVVLATDGQPNCDDVDVTSRIRRLYAATPSVKTYVIGVGDGTAADPVVLGEWAAAGHTDRPGPTKYYQVNSPQDLTDAFSGIVGGVVSCTFQLAQQPPDPEQLYVWMNSRMVPADAQDGYTFDAKGPSVTLHGMACDRLKADAATKVQVVYGCAEPPIQ